MIEILLGLIILCVSSFCSLYSAYKLFIKKGYVYMEYDPNHKYHYERF